MLAIYKDKHFRDRSQPQYFLHYMVNYFFLKRVSSFGMQS